MAILKAESNAVAAGLHSHSTASDLVADARGGVSGGRGVARKTRKAQKTREVHGRRGGVRADSHAREGVLCDWQIEDLITNQVIKATGTITARQIQPASLDLRLGSKAYRVNAAFLPGRRSVKDHIEDPFFHRYELDLDSEEGAVLDTGAVYIVQLQESLDLKKEKTRQIAVKANPKSSLGRLDVLVRVLTECGERFDTIPEEYVGTLYAEISPRTFPIRVRSGDCLTQIRFFRGHQTLSDNDLKELHKKDPLVAKRQREPLFKGGLVIHVNLDCADKDDDISLVYQPLKFRSVIDLRHKEHLVDNFWVRPPVIENSITLEPGAFYLLASKERVRIPEGYAAELEAFDETVGEFRVHYAGFFDPGFGVNGAQNGSRVVLEVRGRDVPFILEHGQPIGQLRFEQLSADSERAYGHKKLGSHYQFQDLRLSKHFKI